MKSAQFRPPTVLCGDTAHTRTGTGNRCPFQPSANCVPYTLPLGPVIRFARLPAFPAAVPGASASEPPPTAVKTPGCIQTLLFTVKIRPRELKN